MLDLEYLSKYLGENKVDSLLIEGGAQIHAAALKAGIVNKVQIYLAPKIVGADGISAVGALGIEDMNRAYALKNPQIERFVDDLKIEYEVK